MKTKTKVNCCCRCADELRLGYEYANGICFDCERADEKAAKVESAGYLGREVLVLLEVLDMTDHAATVKIIRKLLGGFPRGERTTSKKLLAGYAREAGMGALARSIEEAS
jgi:hypothetical protein